MGDRGGCLVKGIAARLEVNAVMGASASPAPIKVWGCD